MRLTAAQARLRTAHQLARARARQRPAAAPLRYPQQRRCQRRPHPRALCRAARRGPSWVRRHQQPRPRPRCHLQRPRLRACRLRGRPRPPRLERCRRLPAGLACQRRREGRLAARLGPQRPLGRLRRLGRPCRVARLQLLPGRPGLQLPRRRRPQRLPLWWQRRLRGRSHRPPRHLLQRKPPRLLARLGLPMARPRRGRGPSQRMAKGRRSWERRQKRSPRKWRR